MASAKRIYTPRGEDKATKSRFLTVAFDEKTRYLLDLAARLDGRTISSLINEAVRGYLPTVDLTEMNVKTPLIQIVGEIWSPMESRRFVRQADRLGVTLMTFEEEVLWHLIQEDDSLWNTAPGGGWLTRDGNAELGIKHDVLHERWEEMKDKANSLAAKEKKNLGTKSKGKK